MGASQSGKRRIYRVSGRKEGESVSAACETDKMGDVHTE